MDNVVPIFTPERWVWEWKAIGGYCAAGEGYYECDGEKVPGLVEFPPRGMCERQNERGRLLRGMVKDRDFRAAVATYLLTHNVSDFGEDF